MSAESSAGFTATPCSNCRRRAGKRRSFDLDLPVVVLCDVCCAALQVGDMDMFRDLSAPR